MKTKTSKLAKLALGLAIAGQGLSLQSCSEPSYIVDTKVVGETSELGPKHVVYKNLSTGDQYSVPGHLSDTLAVGDYFKVEVNPGLLGDAYSVKQRIQKK